MNAFRATATSPATRQLLGPALCCVPIALLFFTAAASEAPFADDALISFRYAENLAHGHGLVYQVQDRVLGASSPLFTLALSLVVSLGANVFDAALALNLLALLGLATAEFALTRRLTGSDTAATVATLLIVTSAPVRREAFSGMETILYCALAVGTLHFVASRRWNVALFTAGLVSLCRYDGYFLMAPVGVLAIAELGRNSLRL